MAPLNAAGSNLLYATYLGSAETEVVEAILGGAGGSAHVAGASHSLDFPTTEGTYPTPLRSIDPSTCGDAFAVRFRAGSAC